MIKVLLLPSRSPCCTYAWVTGTMEGSPLRHISGTDASRRTTVGFHSFNSNDASLRYGTQAAAGMVLLWFCDSRPEYGSRAAASRTKGSAMCVRSQRKTLLCERTVRSRRVRILHEHGHEQDQVFRAVGGSGIGQVVSSSTLSLQLVCLPKGIIIQPHASLANRQRASSKRRGRVRLLVPR